jgi:hypothetical protein
MRGSTAIIVGGFLFGCAGAMQDDGFRARVARGCDSVEHCERLAADAEIRAQTCRPNTIGYVRCSDAQTDIINARVLLQGARDQRTQRQQARVEQQRKEKERAEAVEKRTRDREEAERLRVESEKRARAEREVQARETEKALLTEEAEAERLKLLGRAGRDRELRLCYKAAKESCRSLLQALLGVADSDSEKRALVSLDQQLAGRALDAGPRPTPPKKE